MNRKQLLDTLAVVRPALASASLIQVLTHLCFSEREVFAYNDQIGISAPLEAGFVGAVQGSMLLSMLGASSAENVEMTAAEDALVVRAGGATARIPMMPPEAFLFEMPPAPKKGKGADGQSISVAADFIAAIRGCLRSVSPDTSVPDQLGVTLIPKKKSIDMYSINGASMSHVSVALSGGSPLSRRITISTPFCEQLVRLADGDEAPSLLLAADHSLLRVASGARVFGKFVDVPKPLDFAAQFAEIVPEDLAKRAVKLPSRMKEALERALVFSDPSGERAYTQLSIKDQVAVMTTKSGRGTIRDKFNMPGHPDVAVSADAQWLKVGAAEFDQVLVTEGAIIFRSGRALYLVAPAAG